MGSSSSKAQYQYPRSDYAQGSQRYYSTYPSTQAQFGYYYQQVGSDPTQVQAIPGYYYYTAQRPTSHKKHSSTPAPARHRSSQRRERSGAPGATSSEPSPVEAPEARPVEQAVPPVDAISPSEAPEAPPQPTSQDASAEAPAASVHDNDPVEPTEQVEPVPEPSSKSVAVQAEPELTNPLPSFPREKVYADPHRRPRRAQTTGTVDSRQYYHGPTASMSYKPHLSSQYRPKGKETGISHNHHEALRRQEKKPNGIGGGAFKLLRSFTMPSLPANKTKKSQHTQPLYQPGVHYRFPPTRSGSQSSKNILATAPVAPPAPSGLPITIPYDSPLNPTSSHKILYKKKLYPSAAHLFEAHKFLKHNPELAERIRTSGDSVYKMSKLSWELQEDGKGRTDWPLVWRDKMDEILYMKFTQHPDLRAELMSTGYAHLLDSTDVRHPEVEGYNDLGKALVRVRERLRREGAR